MCQQHWQAEHAERGEGTGTEAAPGSDEPFPWSIGAFDAHCHPTDTMSSIASIPGMRAKALTVMATRSEDQDLVASVAEEHGIQSRDCLSPTGRDQSEPTKLVPAFGWHPWFSHQLYDDISLPAADATYDAASQAREDQKARHYAAVLSSPEPDADLVASLPEPKALSSLVSETRERLLAHPLALVGEVGLDKAFRLPQAWSDQDQSARDGGLTPGGREGRLLSPHHVRMPHQVSVLRAQLKLAGELGRAVSVHGVQAPGVLFETISSLWKGHEKEVLSKRQQRRIAPGAEDFSSDEEAEEGGSQARGGKVAAVPAKPFPPRICLHSYSGSAEMIKQWLTPTIPARIFFSFSAVVNLSTPATEARFPDVIRACPDNQILIESDIHIAGEDMDQLLEQMYRRVCVIKGWELREGVEKIRRNYEEFIFG
ncbi:Metallo-dependent hydrolase [Thozetella sp. PMI_491]|nr:Metallo-dependent hydrolase [Thozetella sp. PMI_491]